MPLLRQVPIGAELGRCHCRSRLCGAGGYDDNSMKCKPTPHLCTALRRMSLGQLAARACTAHMPRARSCVARTAWNLVIVGATAARPGAAKSAMRAPPFGRSPLAHPLLHSARTIHRSLFVQFPLDGWDKRVVVVAIGKAPAWHISAPAPMAFGCSLVCRARNLSGILGFVETHVVSVRVLFSPPGEGRWLRDTPLRVVLRAIVAETSCWAIQRAT